MAAAEQDRERANKVSRDKRTDSADAKEASRDKRTKSACVNKVSRRGTSVLKARLGCQ